MVTPLESSPRRTPEQHDAVRRKSRIFSLCAFVSGIAGIALLLARTIDVSRPPAIFAVNLSFCAMMMGIGIIFYTKDTTRTGISRITCTLAILLGLAGPMVFAKQSMNWHILVENRELGNVAAIAQASQRYAREHAGNYPPDLVVLLRTKTLGLEILRSPFGTMQNPSDIQRMEAELRALDIYEQLHTTSGADLSDYRQFFSTRLLQEVDALSDYQYFGAGLQLPKADPKTATQPAHAFGALPEEIILATSRNAIMTKQISVGFVNGRAVFLDLGGAESALLASNDARTSLGFPAIRPPEVIRRAEDLERRAPPSK